MSTPKEILNLAAKTVFDRLENGREVRKFSPQGEEYVERIPATAAEITAALRVYETLKNDTVANNDEMGVYARKLEAMGHKVDPPVDIKKYIDPDDEENAA
jgi:hypothetical protein